MADEAEGDEAVQRVFKYCNILARETDVEQLARCLRKLSRTQMTVALLKQTGCGKAVNRLRAHADVGEQAAALVADWKRLAFADKPATAAAAAAASRNGCVLPTESGFAAALSQADATSKRRRAASPELPTSTDAWNRVLPKTEPTYTAPSSAKRRYLPPVDDVSDLWQQQAGSSSSSGDEARKAAGGVSGEKLEPVDASMFKAKHGRTHVFAGRRKGFDVEVPKLFDCCMRVVCDNVDAIEETGDIPFEILRPALERATPAQLFYIEERNPYLIDGSDELWRGHCVREFRGAEPTEDEMWRCLYQRKLAEREARLSQVTAAIGRQRRERDSPARVAKLAAPVAPRDVRRRQQRYGTADSAALPTADAISAARRRIGDGAASKDLLPRSVRPPPASGGGGGPSRFPPAPSRPPPPTKAPMMTKVLKMMGKKRRR